MEWVRTDDMGNIVARGIVGEDDPYEDPEEAEKKAAAALLAEGVATNRCCMLRKTRCSCVPHAGECYLSQGPIPAYVSVQDCTYFSRQNPCFDRNREARCGIQWMCKT